MDAEILAYVHTYCYMNTEVLICGEKYVEVKVIQGHCLMMFNAYLNTWSVETHRRKCEHPVFSHKSLDTP